MNKSESFLSCLLSTPDVSAEDILSWYSGNSSLESLLSGHWLSEGYSESLRPGFVLCLLNFLREESTCILKKSQSLCLTPSKGNHPSKYDVPEQHKLLLPEKSHARRSLEGMSSSSKKGGRRSNEVQLCDLIIKKKPQKSRKKIELISQDVSHFNNPAFYSPSPGGTSTDISPIRSSSGPISVKTPKKSASFFPSVEPSPLAVSHRPQLDKLLRLYSFCMDGNLVPNILVELYLLLELLTVRQAEQAHAAPKSNLFHSVHNCVYFAANILLQQVDRLLQFTDRVTLRFLLDNPRLESFVPQLKPLLSVIYEQKREKNASSKSHHQNSSLGDNSFQSVRFQSETDNRTNFPSAQSFQYFRKQRDLFYEILRDSEADDRAGKTPDTKKKMRSKVESLLSSSSHPVNLVHLARLFTSQLLGTTLSFLINGSSGEEDYAGLDEMQELRLSDPLKYQRLQSRFTTPSMYGGPCPRPDFSGPQEFFRDFIANCNNHQFMEHLKASLLGTIIEMNDFSFNLLDDPGSLGHLQEEVLETVTTLRILGKYLGYLESLPYVCSVDNIPDELVFSQISLRKNVTPTLDLIRILRAAISEERLVVTIPWIVEYCSMIDPISVHLPYYQELFSLLVNVYRTILVPRAGKEQGGGLHPMNNLFLCLSLGWLFENSLFPRELLVDSQEMRVAPLTKKRVRHPSKYDISLDAASCVSQNLLYTSCPYLSELKSILSQFLSKDPVKVDTTLNSTPVSSSSPRISSILSSAEKIRKPASQRSPLQLEMEENFFHNQPASLRKTVEFVAERVASNSVKKLRSVLIPQEKKRVSGVMKGRLEDTPLVAEDKSNTSPDLLLKERKDKFLPEVENLARVSCDKIRSNGPAWISDRMKESISVSLKNLLAEDTSPIVLQTSVKITERKTLETACQWIEDHVTLRYFLKDYQQEFNQLRRAQTLKNEENDSSSQQKLLGGSSPLKTNPPQNEGEEEGLEKDPPAPPSKLLIALKMDLKEMLLTSNPLHFSEEYVITLLSDIQLCLTEGKGKICSLGLRGFESFTVDWVISLITFCPSCMTSKVFDKLMEVWSRHLFCQSQIMSILCPRNMVLFGQSTTPCLTWQKLEVLLSRLLKSKILLPIALEDQCIQLLKQEWPEAILKKFASCLQGVVSVWKASNYSSRSGDDEIEFVQLMDWMVWYCSSAEDYVLDKQEFPELV